MMNNPKFSPFARASSNKQHEEESLVLPVLRYLCLFKTFSCNKDNDWNNYFLEKRNLK